MPTYPNITWGLFAAYNDDARTAFENMCRQLFTAEYLKGEVLPHIDHNTPGVEVLPVLEPERNDGLPRKRISFQAKYTEQSSADYGKIKKSAEQTAKHFKGQLDRVYLFCNKALTTTSKQYQNIVKIHSSVGIETIPISNGELLDLVAKYRPIADYFFQPRKVADASAALPGAINGVSLDRVTGNLIISPEVFQQEPLNQGMLNDWVSEKLRLCKDHALTLELDALKDDLSKLTAVASVETEWGPELSYYRLLTCVYDGQAVDDLLEKCGSDYYDEASWLIEFYKNPSELTGEKFCKHTPISQVFAIDKLFNAQFWDNIVQLYESSKDDVNTEIRDTFCMYYGLSLLNLQRNEQASQVLHSLYEKAKQPRIQLYATFADIRYENSVYQGGRNGNRENLAKLIEKLTSLHELKQYRQQEHLVAILMLESLYHLGLSDRAYPEKASEVYNGYSETTRNHIVVQYYYALCLELTGDYDKASAVYEKMPWRTAIGIAERYMTALFLNHEPEKIAQVFQGLSGDAYTPRAEALYLLSLDRVGDETYLDRLKKSIRVHKDSLDELYVIAYYVERADAIQEVLPALRALITTESLQNLTLPQKGELITLLARFQEIGLMEVVLSTIDDIGNLNTSIVGEVYKASFEVARREYVLQNKAIQKPEDFEAVDRIADRFVNSGAAKKLFLQIKALCSGARQMPYSSLYYSKELFKISPDVETARNIVALLYDRKETDPTQYAPYLECLKSSDIPDHCMVLASTFVLLGHDEQAEFYAYKALYVLNGRDDFDTYKHFFGFFNSRLHDSQNSPPLRTAHGAVVLTLAEVDPGDEPMRLDLCLDPEADFSDPENRSLGIEHLPRSSTDYMKLHGSSLQQQLNFRGKKFKIEQIKPRIQVCVEYILGKIQANQEQFTGTVTVLSSENIDDLLKKMKELTSDEEHMKARLRAYHFEENAAGLPIDLVASGNYSKYIPAIKYLLYSPNEALYAGEPTQVIEEEQPFVPSLSTLVLLAILKRLDLLEMIKPVVRIPESYLAFFREEYRKAINTVQTSTSTLFFVGDQPVMQPADNTLPEIWESIVSFCSDCGIVPISDQERMGFKVSDDFTGERLLSGFNMSVIQLDAFILAHKENATFICDDLFFRRLATGIQIPNITIASLVLHFMDQSIVHSFLLELSKTNYIYVPPFSFTDEEALEYIGNISTGEKKLLYYGELINRYHEINEQILQENLGEANPDVSCEQLE